MASKSKPYLHSTHKPDASARKHPYGIISELLQASLTAGGWCVSEFVSIDTLSARASWLRKTALVRQLNESTELGTNGGSS